MSPLRSNFEPGTTRWAMRRAQWTALGLTPDDMEKPKIAIVNSSSDLASEHIDFEDIFAYAGHVATGKMTVGELAEMSLCAVTGPGVCAGLGTANSMGIVIVRGSLAPDGALVKRTVADDGRHQFSGPARVFRSREEGLTAIRAGQVRPGQVLVLTGLGLRGSPGMGLTSAFVFALDGAGLGDQVAVVTDGQMSGLVNKGISVAELPLLAAPAGCGWLSVYARSVRPLGEGATLGG